MDELANAISIVGYCFIMYGAYGLLTVTHTSKIEKGKKATEVTFWKLVYLIEREMFNPKHTTSIFSFLSIVGTVVFYLLSLIIMGDAEHSMVITFTYICILVFIITICHSTCTVFSRLRKGASINIEKDDMILTSTTRKILNIKGK